MSLRALLLVSLTVSPAGLATGFAAGLANGLSFVHKIIRLYELKFHNLNSLMNYLILSH